MNTVFSFIIAGALVRVMVADSTGEILSVVSLQAISLQTFSLACAQARMAWESQADELVSA